MTSNDQISLSGNELRTIDSFCKGKDTAILTIMFTDIVGFTRMTEEKGEVHSANVRAQHDTILKREIEKNNRGLVIKWIGDSVMAIFSEPSAAVECSLDIQKTLDQFNQDAPDEEDIHIRIGLHMGQVTIENNIQADIFGRHVNRASKIESLANGQQILLSYPVFDSAKGWLSSHEHIKWTLHGDYQLPGIDENIAIYEVFDSSMDLPNQPPQGRKTLTKKKSGALPLFATGALILAAIIAAVVVLYPKLFPPPVVHFQELHENHVMLNIDTPLELTTKAGNQIRTSLTEIPPGTHTLHYDANYITRNYAQFDVVRGENIITPKFTQTRLPGMSIRFDIPPEKQQDRVSKAETYQYFQYDKSGKKINHTANLKIDIESAQNDTIITHKVTWEIILDGKTISSDSTTVDHLIAQSNTNHTKSEAPLYSDSFHRYQYHYYTTVRAIDFTLFADLAQYSYQVDRNP